MRDIVNSFKAYPAMSLASAVVWGMVEFVALQRALVTTRVKPQA
ncbi:MAG: hypothetical protein Q7J29_14945 [Stagnimonas sp.]|nr:hypothetical protein [Stagnimonas sp.]